MNRSKQKKEIVWGCVGAFVSAVYPENKLDCLGVCCQSCENLECGARCKAETLRDCSYKEPLSKLLFQRLLNNDMKVFEEMVRKNVSKRFQ